MMALLLLLPWAGVVFLLLSAWLWWKASRIEIPETIGFVQSHVGEGGPIKKLDAVLVRLREQSRLNARGAICAAVAAGLFAIEKVIEQWPSIKAMWPSIRSMLGGAA
jgi:hypothetical protein